MTWPGVDNSLSCTVWDVNEVFRVQLFEKEDQFPKVELLVTSHAQILKDADGSEKRFTLTTPEGEKLVNHHGLPTILRIGTRLEKVDHQANLTVLVEEGKNIKKLGETGPINAYCVSFSSAQDSHIPRNLCPGLTHKTRNQNTHAHIRGRNLEKRTKSSRQKRPVSVPKCRQAWHKAPRLNTRRF